MRYTPLPFLPLQYGAGEALSPGGEPAPIANRFIITADVANLDSGAVVEAAEDHVGPEIGAPAEVVDHVAAEGVRLQPGVNRLRRRTGGGLY